MKTRYKILGLTDDRCECEACGKQNLKCTVALEPVDSDGGACGPVVYFGRDCAALATRGSKSAANVRKVEAEAAAADYAREASRRDKVARIAADRNRANYLYAVTRRPLPGSRFAYRGADVVRVDGSDPADVAFYFAEGFQDTPPACE